VECPVAPALFIFPVITIWQALGLLALTKILFGGFSGRSGLPEQKGSSAPGLDEHESRTAGEILNRNGAGGVEGRVGGRDPFGTGGTLWTGRSVHH